MSLVKRVAEKKLPCEALDGKRCFCWRETATKHWNALTIYEELAIQIFNLQNILDPERFAIGGGSVDSLF